MAVLWLISKILQRKSSLLNTISIAGIIILIIQPADIFNAGFQLSFGAVLSIAIVYPLFRNLKEKLVTVFPKFQFSQSIIDLFLVSVAVQIGTLPFVIGYYEKLSIIALVANIFVVPLTGVILGAGVVAIVILNIFPFVFFLYESAIALLAYLTLNIIKVFGEVSFAYLAVNNFSIMNALIYFLFLGLLIYYLQKDKSPRFKIALSISIIGVFIIYFPIFQQKYLKKDNSYLVFTETKNISSLTVVDLNTNLIKIRKVFDSLQTNKIMNEVIKNIGISERLINGRIQSKIFEGFTQDEINFINAELEFDLKSVLSENKKNLTFSSIHFNSDHLAHSQISAGSILSQQGKTDHNGNKYLIDTKYGLVFISDRNSFPNNSSQILENISKRIDKNLVWIYSDISIDSLRFFSRDFESKAIRFQEDPGDPSQIKRILGTRIFQIKKEYLEEVNWQKI
jgi:ComEC/Rec2-related protein